MDSAEHLGALKAHVDTPDFLWAVRGDARLNTAQQ
jgi:hypothetical protein